MSWDIVIWNNENTCDFVPSCWVNPLKSTEYKYPVGPRMTDIKKKKLVSDCQDITGDFDYYPAICKKANVKSLAKAKHFVTQLTYTSNLESCTESETEIERPTKRKKIPGGKKHDVQPNNWKRPPISAIPGLASNHSTPRQSTSTAIVEYDVDDYYMRIADGIGGFHQSHNVAAGPNISFTPSISTGPVNQIMSCSNNQTTSSSLHGEQSTANEIIDISKTNTTTSDKQIIKSGDNNILDTLNGAVFEIIELKKKIVDLDKTCKLILGKINGSTAQDQTVQSEMLQLLPLKTTEEVARMEELLTDPVNTKILEEILYLVGGDTCHRSVFLQMGKIVSKELALQYSGVGKKKKMPFCHLKLYKAILCACRKRYNATEAEIKKSVSIFLSSAKGRLVKRAEREDKNMEAEGDEQ